MAPDIKAERFNPFPGLRPFLPEESDLFFGREGESEEVLRKLLRNRFITVIGASGSGKSSLIYCGILPKVRKLKDSSSAKWRIITLRPGNDPTGNLAEAFSNSYTEAGKPGADIKTISSLLLSGPDGIARVVNHFNGNSNEKLLILVDQFEELFRYKTAASGAEKGENAGAFVTLIEKSVSSPEAGIYTIITMRSDFIGECAHFQGFTQLINDSNYLVPHMNRENYRAAIEGPVKYAGASIDQKLVETLLDDIGDRTDQLPVLQHALMRTWAHWQELDEPGRPLAFIDYDSVGTMSDAMSRHANEAFEELSLRGKEICEKTFKTIAEKGADNKGIRHPSSIKLLKSIIQCSSEELFEVVEKFRIASRSFITPRENVPLSDDSVIDLSHESLMRLWDRLKEWVDDEAAAVQMYLRLSEASAMYQQGKTTLWRPPDLQLAINWREQYKPTLTWAERYDPAFERAMVYLRTSEKEYQAEEENKIRLQKRQMKRARIVAIILGTAALISVGFMLYAFVQQIKADKAKIEADNNARAEKEQRGFAEAARIDALNQKSAADSAKLVALDQKSQADSAKVVAQKQEAIATKNFKEAQVQRTRAEIEADSARRARQRALESAAIATRNEMEALRLRMLSIGKAMSVKSMQVQGQKDLQTLLVYQAYLFNKNNRGNPNDADIYSGLYNVAKQYGNVNYKKFTGHSGEIKSVAFVPGKRELYTSATDGKVLKWNLDNKDQNIQVVYSGTEIIEVLAVSQDAGWLACGGSNSVIKMIPLKANNIEYTLKGHTGKIKSLFFSFDGKYLYSASLDGKVIMWDMATRTSRNLSTDGLQIVSIDISTNGDYLAGVSNNGKVIVWDPRQTTPQFSIEPKDRTIRAVRFKPGENTIAIGYTDGYLELYDISSKQRIGAPVKAHEGQINDIQFNNKLSQIATASNDKTLKIWDTRDLTIPPITFNDDEAFVMVIGFSPDGELIVSGTYGDALAPNLVARPTYVDLIAKDVCTTVSRNLSLEEWARYVDKELTYEKTCQEKDFNIKVNAIR